MGREPRVDRSPEEEWRIVQEGIKSGNVSDTYRRYGIAPNLLYRWKDEAEQGAKAALGPPEGGRYKTGVGDGLPGLGFPRSATADFPRLRSGQALRQARIKGVDGGIL
jgi:transposase-like protein